MTDEITQLLNLSKILQKAEYCSDAIGNINKDIKRHLIKAQCLIDDEIAKREYS